MRSLVVLRGAMGSGKSTWIKEHKLEAYTLSPDTLRLMYSSPQMQPDSYQCTINQKNDGEVWELLHHLLEMRMKKGEFTIIDATHSKQSDFSQYNNLCETYRYRKYYIDFTDVPIDVCKTRNATRFPAYKRVPDAAIDKCYARFETQKVPNSWTKIEKELIHDFLNIAPVNFDEYDKVHIFGDIHGCLEPLKEYLTKSKDVAEIDDIVKSINSKEFYIFVGDYIDRGIQNKEVMELLCELSELPNTLFLPGNHEEWLRMYSFDDVDSIRNKEFKNKTVYELKDIPHIKIGKFVRKIGQIAYFIYDGQEYFVSHGGVPYVPDDLQLVATEQFTRGVGTYEFDIDKQYSENTQRLIDESNVENVTIQVHGHRNTFGIKADEYPFTYNLEGKIEFGGDLRVLVLEHNKQPQVVCVKNDVYNKGLEIRKYTSSIQLDSDPVAALRSHTYIKETKLGDTISSFNFTRDAFYNKHWDGATIAARGLFMNVETGKVVARAYDKFFNINERQETKMMSVRARLEKNGGAIAYKKYNGYLGILSYYDGDLHFHSKSTDTGDFVTWFKDIFMSNISDGRLASLRSYLETNDVSMVFEVIDPVNDPHIIENDKAQVILLDVIDNSLEYHKLDYENLCNLAQELGLQVKEVVAEFKDFRSLMQFWLDHTDVGNMDDTDIEGVVLEIDDFMVKMKFNYYNFWKMCRSVVEKLRNNHTIKLSQLYNDKANYFYNWLKEQDVGVLEKDIITLRNMFERK